ncbi:MAG: KilA-N domain-containing protein [Bacteroidia bacterium]|nr:KilA-N domain-containing protein [Bacteroidales bacterium]NCD42509.1 KilA-N domain-containing protein [Bacteroidia bacterium]MDD3010705.1 KilA-N domain-containing protein [Bacteroidales bacterium]MDD3962676.1 KilA-N domain-containing protein [Bacteroidales bacterium]MDY0285135.1 KilA-N domain-containing protein [Bacteroidales bacterium]
MEVVHFIYNETEVDFLPGGNENVMVNATQMAKIFGKDVFQFTRIDDTKRFIEACLKPQNCGLLGIENEQDLIISRQKSGTWMHRVLALKFAAWLDSDFEVWVFSTIDKIILGHYKEMRDATIEKLQAEKEHEEKKKALIEKHPELAEIFEIELKISAADKKRIKALKASVAQLKLDLFAEPAN